MESSLQLPEPGLRICSRFLVPSCPLRMVALTDAVMNASCMEGEINRSVYSEGWSRSAKGILVQWIWGIQSMFRTCKSF